MEGNRAERVLGEWEWNMNKAVNLYLIWEVLGNVDGIFHSLLDTNVIIQEEIKRVLEISVQYREINNHLRKHFTQASCLGNFH